MSDLVLLDVAAGVATLTLNRPERHNSLVPPLLTTLLERIWQVGSDAQVRAVVLRAAGRSFSTGGDIAAFYAARDRLAAYAGELVGLLNASILALQALPQPVIAAVHGLVTGGSLGLLLAADVVIVTPEARFAPYYGVVGFSPDGGWTALLPQRIGRARTMAILAENRTVSADEALAWGLATNLVPAAALDDAVARSCDRIGRQVAGSLSAARSLIAAHDADLPARLEAERRQFLARIVEPDVAASMAAFLARRQT